MQQSQTWCSNSTHGKEVEHHWASQRHDFGTPTIKVIIQDKAVSLTCIRQVCPAGLPWPELTRQTHHRTLGSMLCIHLEYSQHYNFCYLFTFQLFSSEAITILFYASVLTIKCLQIPTMFKELRTQRFPVFQTHSCGSFPSSLWLRNTEAP